MKRSRADQHKCGLRWMAGFCLLSFSVGTITPTIAWAAHPASSTIVTVAVSDTHQKAPRGREENPSMAFNPLNSKMGIVAYTESKDEGPTKVASLGLTKDGGLSYQNKKLDNTWTGNTPYVTYRGTGAVDGSHVAYNGAGKACIVTTAKDRTHPEYEQFPVLTCSTDDGKHWSQPIAVAPPSATNRYTACQVSFDPANPNGVYVPCRQEMANEIAPGQVAYNQFQMMLFSSTNGGSSFASRPISAPTAPGDFMYYPEAPVFGPNAKYSGQETMHISYGNISQGTHRLWLYTATNGFASEDVQLVGVVPCLLRVTFFGSHTQPSVWKTVINDGHPTLIGGTCLGLTYQLVSVRSNTDGSFSQTPDGFPANSKPVTPSVLSPGGEGPSSIQAVWSGWPSKYGYIFNRSVVQRGNKVDINFRAASWPGTTGDAAYNQNTLNAWVRDQTNNLAQNVAIMMTQFVAGPVLQSSVLTALIANVFTLDEAHQQALEAALMAAYQSGGDPVAAFTTACNNALGDLGGGVAAACANLLINLPTASSLADLAQANFGLSPAQRDSLEAALGSMSIADACNSIFGAGSGLANACINLLMGASARPLFQQSIQVILAVCTAAGGPACFTSALSALLKAFASAVGWDPEPLDNVRANLAAQLGISEDDVLIIWAAAITSQQALGPAILQACKNPLLNGGAGLTPAQQAACFNALFAIATSGGNPSTPAGSLAATISFLTYSVGAVLETLTANLVSAGVPPIAAKGIAAGVWQNIAQAVINGDPQTIAAICASFGPACAPALVNAFNSLFNASMSNQANVFDLLNTLFSMAPAPSGPNQIFTEELIREAMNSAVLGDATLFTYSMLNPVNGAYPENQPLVANTYMMTCEFSGGDLVCPPDAAKVASSPLSGTVASWNSQLGTEIDGAMVPGVDPFFDISTGNLGTQMGSASTAEGKVCTVVTDTRNITPCDAVTQLQFAMQQGGAAMAGSGFTWGDFQLMFEATGVDLDLGALVDPNDPAGEFNHDLSAVCDPSFDNTDIYAVCKQP